MNGLLRGAGSTALGITLASLILSGCSFMVPTHQSIEITASNPNADIYVDNELLGQGSVTASLSKRENHSIMAKCGDGAGVGKVTRSLSGAAIADIVGGAIWLVPLIGLAAPGSRKLSPKHVSIAIVGRGSRC